MSKIRSNDGLALLQHGEQAQSSLITQAQVQDLPEVMQRYLRYAQVIEKEPICTIRLKQQGVMKISNVQQLTVLFTHLLTACQYNE